MKIQRIEINKKDSIEVGDILESASTGNMYLILNDDILGYNVVNLNMNRIANTSSATIKALVDRTVDDYILHKKRNIKIVIEEEV